ncbi:MAG: FHA domain-containing protein [Lachnospiraceae bacterium]|nr:FHA domain-containing protein [Lachnospiraceae bacterium]
MALMECANGHLYEATQYASCPYCSGGMNRMEFNGGGYPNIGKTVGVFGAAPEMSSMNPGGEVGATVAPAGYQGSNAEDKKDDDIGKTVAVMQKSMNVDPVVGWLVCVEGADKGKDYRVYGKNNTIGRSEKSDIVIKGDSTISRENHAKLAYDIKHNNFHIIPADGTNGIYVNDQPTYIPTMLSRGDVIEMGESKFIFIPFCDEKFNWQDGLGKVGE